MIQYNTKNNSFLKVHLFLKQKGIKNNAFFLELKDESLFNVDPFDEENLTDEQKQRIIIECSRNIWYFLRECCKIPGSGINRYELNLGNLAITWSCLNNLNNYCVMPRQCGKTFAVMAVMCWILYFGGKNTEMILFAQQQSNLDNNMNRIKSIRNELPSYLRFVSNKDRDGSIMDFKALGNSIIKQAPGRSEESADNRGRGTSKPVMNYDEFGFIPYIRTQYQASILAQTTVARAAERAGLPHFVSITTTAAFLNNDSGIYAHNFFLDSLEFHETFYDMDINDVKSILRNEAKRNFIAIEYQYWDLGKGDDYFEEQCKALNYDTDAIDREVLNKWKTVGTSHPLGQEAITNLEKYKIAPIHVAVINSIYRMKLYRDPDTIDWEGTPYIIGGDCSNNVGSDYSALVVIDPYTYEVVATIRTNMYSTMLFAQMIADLMSKYFCKGILVLERNLNGATIIDRLIEINSNLASRIYASIDKNGKIKELGMSTTEKSRDLVYGQVLKIAIDDSSDRIHDKVIIEEIKSLIRKRNGRIDHPEGGHDDLLISYLFTRWFLLYADYIERYIDPLKIGCMYNDYIYGKGKDNKMRDIKNTRLSEIDYEEKKKNLKLKSKRASETELNKPGSFVIDLESQNEKIKNETFSNSSTNAKSNMQGILDSFESFMSSRYNNIPERVENDNGELYTLDDDELKEEEDKLYDETYQEKIYNARPEDIQINKKKINTVNQYIRKQTAENTDYSDLRYFMSQFKR